MKKHTLIAALFSFSLALFAVSPLLAASQDAFDLNEEGLELLETGKYTEAKAKFIEAFEADSSFIEARVNAARAAESENPPDWVTVKTQYLTVVTYMDEENFEANLGLANYYVKTDNFAEAKNYYDKALDLEPRNAAIHFGLGNMHHKMKKMDLASAKYAKTIEMDKSSFPTAYLRIGVHEFNKNRKTKKYEAAIVHLKKYLTMAGDDDNRAIVHNRLGMIYFDTGKQAKALEHYSQAKQFDVSDHTNYYYSGVIYLRTKNSTKAEKEFLDCLKQKPGYGEAHFNLAVIYQQQYMYQEAVVQYKAAASDRNFNNRAKARDVANQIEAYLQKVKEAQGAEE